MIHCDKCSKPCESCIYVKNKFCSPGYGSKFDCESEQIFIELKDGEYCCACLDFEIENMGYTHLKPKYKYEAFNLLINCDCEFHHNLRSRGGEMFLKMLNWLR